MERVPVTVITGFLGSGKTTLLNRLLRSETGFRLAVVVNEFGDVGVDGALVSGGELFVELDNGCLCCALNSSLEDLLRQLSERGGFDHLVIETTGLADPLGVAWTFERPGLISCYRMDAVVTVVDAANLERALQESLEAQVQVERADLLLLNKIDLVEDGGAGAEARIAAINPSGRILRAVYSDVPWSVVLDSDLAGSGSNIRKPDLHRHSPFESWSFQTPELLSSESLEDLLYELPGRVYRVKGVVRTRSEAGWHAVHCVAGRFDIAPVSPSRPPGLSRLVFIGRNLDRAELARMCKTLTAGA
jgi:G3E family GTPase